MHGMHGLCMACAWSVHGMHGQCMASAWPVHGSAWQNAWHMHGFRILAKYDAWAMHGKMHGRQRIMTANALACMANAWVKKSFFRIEKTHGTCMAKVALNKSFCTARKVFKSNAWQTHGLLLKLKI